MNIDIGSFAYGGSVQTGGNTPSWGTSLGQSQPDYKFTYPGAENMLIGMMYCSIPLKYVSLPLGKGGRVNIASEISECQLASLFNKVYINEKKIDYPFLMVLVREESASHTGRRTIKYSDKIAYNDGVNQYSNQQFIKESKNILGLADDACWFVYSMEILHQDELHMYSVVVDAKKSVKYQDSQTRRKKWLDLLNVELKDSHSANIQNQNKIIDGPLQQIFYGAPGTGKSYKIKELTGKENVIRTTFHPDSDYSTFVGAYKPTMKSSERIYSPEELTVKLKEIKSSGTPYPCHKFSAKYWNSLKDLKPDQIKSILSACGFTETFNVEVSKGVAIGQEYLDKSEDGRITYSFIPQAFLNAYIKAWKMYAENENDPKKQYLVIEEINRGNCAQIFGDLFQLLDRDDNGFSEYPIEADKDMQKHLANAFQDMAYLEAPAIGEMSAEETAMAIRNGEKLILPNNLYIWATMNTSDQSLFPIDSAFKRRWDWEYIPIHDCKKGWRIAANGNEYDWWSFLEKINNVINKLTSSEDKKLGYFFCKADENGVISEEKFVSKVLFYLWNDVFKDYEVDTNILKDGESTLNFNSFYGVDGKETVIRKDKVDLFLSNLKVAIIKGSALNSQTASEVEE